MMDLHPGLMIWTIISFVIFLIILKKAAWNPILKALEERENGIKNDINAAKSAREEAEQSLAEYQRKLQEAQAEAQSFVVDARQTAERVKEDMLAKAKEEADALVEKARKQIDLERQAAINQIRGEIAALTIASAEKIITKSLDDEDHRRLVMESLQESES
ncbi:MAG: F0F1 ATP synthase subunit B [Candidatus Electryoneaceae bacterium]|nr:F0F1 ATP synthase subunit B [Candidatus Electryoneaceae bacterium]